MNKEMREYPRRIKGFISKGWIIDSIKEMDDIDFHEIFEVVRERYNDNLMEVEK
tara:strand:+ start:1350 stop:1511 length:162 start_codon:yes stop_codon:yes gene_type:complete